MSGSILNTALSGLAAFQRSLEVTSNNISNVNTDGYSRQRAELATRPEQYSGSGYLGTGVNVVNITRSYDQFISGQVRSSTSAFNEVDSFYKLSAQVDNLIADETTGVAPAMKEFFNAVNDVANDPTSIPARQVMLAEAESMSQRFNSTSVRLSDMRQQVNSNLDKAVDDVNGYAKAIADLNVKIVADIGKAAGKRMPNELMDQRDVLLNKIAEKVDVSVVPQQDGSVSVFIGQGQSLVLGSYASALSIQGSSSDVNHKEILMNGQNISNMLSGGEMYGNLRFRDELLDPAQQQLDDLANGLVTKFNEIHMNGHGLYSISTGNDFFEIVSSTNPAATMKVKITDPKEIAAAIDADSLGDNRNALKLAELESTPFDEFGAIDTINGKTFIQGYTQLVTNVGSKTHSASVSRTAQDVLLKQATGARENLAGVNLDEEAANLIKFQNSYQAAAKAVSVANTLFDTLIGAVR